MRSEGGTFMMALVALYEEEVKSMLDPDSCSVPQWDALCHIMTQQVDPSPDSAL